MPLLPRPAADAARPNPGGEPPLFFSDLALRRQNASILPNYDAVIFDEAHTLEAVAGDHLGLSISNGQIEYALRKLYNERNNKGLLVYHRLGDAQQAVLECRVRAEHFFGGLDEWLAEHPQGNGRVRTPKIVENRLSEELEKLAACCACTPRTAKSPKKSRISLLPPAGSTGWPRASRSGRHQSLEDSVYWVEKARRAATGGGSRWRPPR